MSSIAEGIMVAVLARLTDPSPTLAARVRRSHRTPVTREDGSTVDLIEGDDIPERSNSECDRERTKSFRLSICVRDDAGATAADDLVVAVNARLDPSAIWLPLGVVLQQGPITVDEEIADEDAVRIDMNFTASYTAPGWSLEAA